MTAKEVIVHMKAKGYTHFASMAGPLPLDGFDPYGLNGTNYREGYPEWQGDLREGEDRVTDRPRDNSAVNGQFYLGVWSFTKEEQP